MDSGFSRNRFSAFVAIIGSIFLLVACGGSGGGGGTAGLSYTGLSTPAEISPDNTLDIAANAYYAGSTGSVFTGMASLNKVAPPETSPSRPFLSDVTGLMKTAMETIDVSTSAGAVQALSVESESDSFFGGCGGEASFNIQMDTDTGNFTGSLEYGDYCEDGISIDGKTNFSGSINLVTGEMEFFAFEFDRISGTSGSEAFTLDGSLSFTVSGPSMTTNMNMLFRDDNLNKVYRLENYQTTMTEGISDNEIRAGGRFYDPDYGYVTLSTPSPFRVYDYDEYPYTGTLVVTGKNNAIIMLMALDASQCQVMADIDGDGFYDGEGDFDSGIIFWSDI